ncbi:GNAT family N-acetyltransferase [Pseudidiomarina aestuarii]|uniref:GNAT family N-acetyltransferase n=1 Tax=Pseudidiomarina aestuarii TaxID=624146 RepID=UPI003A987DC4
MTTSMTNPHDGMISFQQALRDGILRIERISGHQDLFSHFDVPTPGTRRLTYVRLSEDRKTVKAFLSCIFNGKVDGFPCVAVGYAVPENQRNQGYAKEILQDAINDQISQSRRNGIKTLYVEAVVDVTNVASQRVAESVIGKERESIIDSVSRRPAYRYTARFSDAS